MHFLLLFGGDDRFKRRERFWRDGSAGRGLGLLQINDKSGRRWLGRGQYLTLHAGCDDFD